MSTAKITDNSQLNQYQENSLERIPLIPRQYSFKVPSSYRELYNLLIFLSSKDGFSRASDDYLARKLRRPVKTIERQLKTLTKMGFIFRNTWSLGKNLGCKRKIVTRESLSLFVDNGNVPMIRKDEERYAFYYFMENEPDPKRKSPPETKMRGLYPDQNVRVVSKCKHLAIKKDKEKVGKGDPPTPFYKFKKIDPEKRLENDIKTWVKKGYDESKIRAFVFFRRPALVKEDSNPYGYIKKFLEDPNNEFTLAKEYRKRETEQRGKEAEREKAHLKKVGRAISSCAERQSQKLKINVSFDEIAAQITNWEGTRTFQFNEKGIKRLKKFLTDLKVTLPKEIL